MRCDDILAEFSTWPFGLGTSNQAGPVTIGGGATRKREGGSGGIGRDSVQELVREVRKEMAAGSTVGAGAGGGSEDQEELCFEVIATVLEIFGRMDSLVSQQQGLRLNDSSRCIFTIFTIKHCPSTGERTRLRQKSACDILLEAPQCLTLRDGLWLESAQGQVLATSCERIRADMTANWFVEGRMLVALGRSVYSRSNSVSWGTLRWCRC